MNILDAAEVAMGWAIASSAGKKADVAEEKKKADSYEEATEKGNFWDAFVCSLGRGIYFWSDGTCEYGTGPTMHK